MINQETNKDKVTLENQDLKEVVDTFKSIFDDLSEDACLSSILLEQNIQDSFSKVISDTIKNPLHTSFEALTAIEKTMKELIHESIVNYLVANKKKIKEVYKLNNSGNTLYYNIILNNSKVENRGVLYKFLSSYEKTQYGSRFPVVFQDIPNEIVKEFKKEIDKEKYIQIF